MARVKDANYNLPRYLTNMLRSGRCRTGLCDDPSEPVAEAHAFDCFRIEAVGD